MESTNQAVSDQMGMFLLIDQTPPRQCWTEQNFQESPESSSAPLAVPRYVDEWSLPSVKIPTTSDWTTPSLTDANTSSELVSDGLVPMIKKAAPKSVLSGYILVRASIARYICPVLVVHDYQEPNSGPSVAPYGGPTSFSFYFI